MSFGARRIIALIVVLLVSTIGGLLAIALMDSRLAAIAGVVLGVMLGAVVGVVLVLIWADRSLRQTRSRARKTEGFLTTNAHLYPAPQHVVSTRMRRAGEESVNPARWSETLQDAASEVRRTHLPRTPVHKGCQSVRFVSTSRNNVCEATAL
jgi:gas vesicle protein